MEFVVLHVGALPAPNWRNQTLVGRENLRFTPTGSHNRFAPLRDMDDGEVDEDGEDDEDQDVAEEGDEHVAAAAAIDAVAALQRPPVEVVHRLPWGRSLYFVLIVGAMFVLLRASAAEALQYPHGVEVVHQVQVPWERSLYFFLIFIAIFVLLRAYEIYLIHIGET